MDQLVGEEVYEVSGEDLAAIGVAAPELIGAKKRKRRADRRYVLGFNALAAAVGAQVLTGAPSLDFRPDRLILVDGTANNTLVTAIQAGNINQVLGGSVPAAAFGPTAVGSSMVGQTVRAPTSINVNVTMAAAGILQGCVFGLCDQ